MKAPAPGMAKHGNASPTRKSPRVAVRRTQNRTATPKISRDGPVNVPPAHTHPAPVTPSPWCPPFPEPTRAIRPNSEYPAQRCSRRLRRHHHGTACATAVAETAIRWQHDTRSCSLLPGTFSPNGPSGTSDCGLQERQLSEQKRAYARHTHTGRSLCTRQHHGRHRNHNADGSRDCGAPTPLDRARAHNSRNWVYFHPNTKR